MLFFKIDMILYANISHKTNKYILIYYEMSVDAFFSF